jgi:hypothetical protein
MNKMLFALLVLLAPLCLFGGGLVYNEATTNNPPIYSATNLIGQINPANLPVPFVNVLKNGVTNDGATDVTTNLQNLLNQGGAFYFPAGRYYCQELQITNNTALLFNEATLVYATNAWNTNIFVREMLNTNINIFGALELDGGNSFNPGMYPNVATNTFHNYHGDRLFSYAYALEWNYWNGCGLRHGFQFNTESKGHVDAVIIHGFNGIGLMPLSISGQSSDGTPKSSIDSVNCFSNLVGFYSAQNFTAGYITNWVTNYVPNAKSPEYTTWSKVHCGENTVGMTFEAANSTLVNSDISGNYINDLEFGGSGNDHHGIISSTSFNHSTLVAIVAGGSLQGETYSSCTFRGNIANNGFTLSGCAGWKFVDCTFDQPLAITNDGNANFFINNLYSGTWSNVSLSGGWIYYGNQSYTIGGDTDGQGGPVDPFGVLSQTSSTGDGYSMGETVLAGNGETFPGVEITGQSQGVLIGYDPLGGSDSVVIGGTSTTISNQLILPLTNRVPTGVTVGVPAPDGWLPVTVNGTNGSVPWWHNH